MNDAAVFVLLLMAAVVLFFGMLIGHNMGRDPVEAGVGRTFQCEKVDAVKVDGEYLKGEACRAVDK